MNVCFSPFLSPRSISNFYRLFQLLFMVDYIKCLRCQQNQFCKVPKRSAAEIQCLFFYHPVPSYSIILYWKTKGGGTEIQLGVKWSTSLRSLGGLSESSLKNWYLLLIQVGRFIISLKKHGNLQDMLEVPVICDNFMHFWAMCKIWCVFCVHCFINDLSKKTRLLQEVRFSQCVILLTAQ